MAWPTHTHKGHCQHQHEVAKEREGDLHKRLREELANKGSGKTHAEGLVVLMRMLGNVQNATHQHTTSHHVREN